MVRIMMIGGMVRINESNNTSIATAQDQVVVINYFQNSSSAVSYISYFFYYYRFSYD